MSYVASTPKSYLYLNRDNRWLGFQMQGLDRGPGGALRLPSLPRYAGPMPDIPPTWLAPTAPAGVAVGPDGTTYFTDPDDTPGGGEHIPLQAIGCDERAAPVPCLRRYGNQPTEFRRPRGLLYHPQRRALLVADSGNGRLQLFDPASWQLLGIWGEGGALQEPWSLAVDSLGASYVADHGSRCVQKFDLDGHLIPEFATTLGAQATVPVDPVGVATGVMDGQERIFVLDAGRMAVLAYDRDGHEQATIQLEQTTIPLALTFGDGRLYVGDNASLRVLVFTPEGAFLGEAGGYRGPVAALACESRVGLLLHPGNGLVPLHLSTQGAYARLGWAWGGPFSNPGQIPQDWHLLSALVDLPADAHLRFYLYAARDCLAGPVHGSAPPWSAPADLAECLASGDWEGRWIRLPLDAKRGVIGAMQPDTRRPDGAAPLRWLWVGFEFTGEGQSSPALSQIRIDFDHETAIQHLPAIYRIDGPARQFLERYLVLFEGPFDDIEARIDTTPRLFDPAAAPADSLGWLAGWLGLELDRGWSEAERRLAIAAAFARYRWRGTVSGLRQAVRQYTGVDVRIDEPLLQTSWWSLAADDAEGLAAEVSILGVSTMLGSAEPQGAVLGTSAVLDGSRLITDDEFGSPLFEDVAYRFSVQFYRGAGYSQETRDAIRAVLDREKPAHTVYQLCVVEPAMRVGFQARLGIDSIVGGPPEPTTLDDPLRGPGLLLGGELPGRLGSQSRIGQTTLLGGRTPL